MSSAIKPVRAVARTLSILDTFLQHRGALGVAEVARLTNQPKSTAYRLLLTLAAHGYLLRDANDKFTLGPKLGGESWWAPPHGLPSLVASVLSDLRDTCGETVGLHVLAGHERVCVAAAEGARTQHTSGRIGSRAPLHSGASSKAIMAFLPVTRWDEIIKATGLASLTEHTVTDPERLRQELVAIRAAGYAVSHGEWGKGITSVAAPIFDPTRTVIGSINISGPSSRFGSEKVNLLVGALQAAAALISERLAAATAELAAGGAP